MPRPGFVFDFILDELEPAAPTPVMRGDRFAGVQGGDRLCPIDRNGASHAAEDRPQALIPLKIDPPDFARSVIVIEVRRELVVLGFQLQHPTLNRVFLEPCMNPPGPRPALSSLSTEMPIDIATRSKQALLLSAQSLPVLSAVA